MIFFYILAFTILSVWIDWQHLSKNQYIDTHFSRWLLRALFVVAVSNTIKEAVGMTLLFTALFDALLNKVMKKDLFYLGKVAIYDNFWSRIPYLYMCFKVISLFVGLYLLLC